MLFTRCWLGLVHGVECCEKIPWRYAYTLTAMVGEILQVAPHDELVLGGANYDFGW